MIAKEYHFTRDQVMRMTMREVWSLTCSDQQISPTFEGQNTNIAKHFQRAWKKKRDKAIRNLMAGKRWDAKE